MTGSEASLPPRDTTRRRIGLWLLIVGPLLIIGLLGLLFGGWIREEWTFRRRMGELREAVRTRDEARLKAATDGFAGEGERFLARLARRACETEGAEHRALSKIVRRILDEAAAAYIEKGGVNDQGESPLEWTEVSSMGAQRTGREEVMRILNLLPLDAALIYDHQATCGGDVHRTYAQETVGSLWIPPGRINIFEPGSCSVGMGLLWLLPVPPGGGSLARLLREAPEETVRAEAALAMPGDEAAAARLRERLERDSSPLVRCAAARRLSLIVDRRNFAPLARALRRDKNKFVRLTAAKALGTLGAFMRRAAGEEGAVRALTETMRGRTDDAKLRAMAACALGAIRSPRAVSALITVLLDDGEEADLRHAAAGELLFIESPEISSVFRRVRDEERDENMLFCASLRLAREGDARARGQLLRRLREGNPDEDWPPDLVYGLGELGGEDVIDALAEAAGRLAPERPSENFKVGFCRDRIGQALSDALGKTATLAELIGRARAEKREHVRTAALEVAFNRHRPLDDLRRRAREPAERVPPEGLDDLAELSRAELAPEKRVIIAQLLAGPEDARAFPLLDAMLTREMAEDVQAAGGSPARRKFSPEMPLSPRVEIAIAILRLAAEVPEDCRDELVVARVWPEVWAACEKKEGYNPGSVLERLNEVREPVVTNYLLRLLAEESDRFALLGWLGERRDPRARGALEKLLREERNRQVRYSAAEALGKLGDPRAVGALRAALRDEESALLCLALLTALARLGEDDALTELVERTRAPDVLDRVLAATWLAALVGKDVERKVAARAAAAVHRLAIEDPCVALRAAVLHFVDRDSPVGAALLFRLATTDRSAEVRFAAASALSGSRYDGYSGESDGPLMDEEELRELRQREGTSGAGKGGGRETGGEEGRSSRGGVPQRPGSMSTSSAARGTLTPPPAPADASAGGRTR